MRSEQSRNCVLAERAELIWVRVATVAEYQRTGPARNQDFSHMLNNNPGPRVIMLFVILSWSTAIFADTIANNISRHYPQYPPARIEAGADKAKIARGEYLVKLGDCMACHTDTANGGAPFAGGLRIETPFGALFVPNITPDKETGIGNL